MTSGDNRHTETPAPSVSVVTTVYNRKRSLPQAIESVLNQSFTDFEYIVVDDGSTDGSADMAESIGDPRVNVVRMPHRGRAAALNTAFALCRGEFILIQDSDDVALPERFAKQIAFLRAHPEVGMLGCQCVIVDDEEKPQRPFRLPVNHAEILPLMMLTSAVVFGAGAIRRSAAEAAGKFDESLVAAEDYDFQLRMLPHARFHNLEEDLQRVHVTEDSLSTLHREEQDRITMDRALRFLSDEQAHRTVFPLASERRLCEARVHYYYGDSRDVRRILAPLLRTSPLDIRIWRYYLPASLGTAFLLFARRNGFVRLLARGFKRSRVLRRHFLP